MSTERWMDKEVVVHIPNGILLGHKKECIWVSSGEVILTHIYSLEKWFWRIYLQGSSRERDIENRLMDMERGEETVRCMERVTWKLTWSYVKQIANRNLMDGLGNSNRGSVSTSGVGWGGRWEGGSEGRGIYVYLWLINVEVWQTTAKFCKAIILP